MRVTVPRYLQMQVLVGKRSRKAEGRTALRLRGRITAGSGSVEFAQGLGSLGFDIRTERFAIEHKRTDLGVLALQAAWLDKVKRVADREGRIPVLVFEFGEPPDVSSWVVVPRWLSLRNPVSAYHGEVRALRRSTGFKRTELDALARAAQAVGKVPAVALEQDGEAPWVIVGFDEGAKLMATVEAL